MQTTANTRPNTPTFTNLSFRFDSTRLCKARVAWWDREGAFGRTQGLLEPQPPEKIPRRPWGRGWSKARLHVGRLPDLFIAHSCSTLVTVCLCTRALHITPMLPSNSQYNGHPTRLTLKVISGVHPLFKFPNTCHLRCMFLYLTPSHPPSLISPLSSKPSVWRLKLLISPLPL